VPIAIVLTLIALVSTAFLLYQYCAGTLLVDDGDRGAERPATPAEPANVREFHRPRDARADTAA
jgi:hypothetical protein